MKPRPKKRFAPLNPATVVLIKQGLRGLAVFTVVGLLITAIWHGTRVESLTLKTVTVTGNETIPEREIEKAVELVLDGTYLGLVPRAFTWLYPETEVLTALHAIPRVKTVTLEQSETSTLSVAITEYEPDALWCNTESENECLFLDETGYAFASAPNLTGGSLLRYFMLQSKPERGVNPFAAGDYQATKDFVAGLASTGWFVSTVEIDVVRDAFFTLVPSSEIKITLVDEVGAPLRYIETLRGSAEYSHLTPGNFQYLDLRFGAKVFVNEEPLELSTTTATTTDTELTEPEPETPTAVVE
jgi:hypothetical protein